MARCYLGLGSNLAQPHRQLQQAIEAIRKLPRTGLHAQSRKYHSKPMGLRAQPDYLNMVLAINTYLSPQGLLRHCKTIEQKQLRISKQHWGSRTLDIDILLFAEQEISQPQLTIPHPGLLKRDFVLLPLLDIAPNLCLPNGQAIADYADFPKGWVEKIMK